MGLILSVDHPRRLFSLHHCMEAVHGHSPEDVIETLELAREASCCDSSHVPHKTRLPGDKDPSHVSGESADCLADKKVRHLRGVPFHSQIQGKIERWHHPPQTASCSRVIICPTILKRRSKRSSNTTTNNVVTRTSKTPHPHMPTLSKHDRRLTSSNRWTQIFTYLKPTSVPSYLTMDSG